MAKTTGGFGWGQGTFSKQPHVDIPDGTYEEEHGRQGFFGRASHLYHRHPPTGRWPIEGDLKPRAYQAAQIQGLSEGEPEWFLQNPHVRLGISKLSRPRSIIARNPASD